MGNNQKNTIDQKNLILALGLSFIIITAWQSFFAPKDIPQEPVSQTEQVQNMPSDGNKQSGLPGTPSIPGSASATTFETREAALKATPRIAINTPALQGSLNLEGAQFDDLHLKKYRETLDPNSPTITLFSPKGTEQSYFANFGWLNMSGSHTVSLPTNKTIWTANHQELTPESPVTLTWDNGQGIIFERNISVDDKAMFTIKDTVRNTTDQIFSLSSYGLISRQIPEKQETSYAILHEGALGVLGNEYQLQELTLASLKDASVLPGRGTSVKGETWQNVVGGFLGITEKYWGAAVIPDQTVSYEGTFSVSEGKHDSIQVDLKSSSLNVPAQGTIQYTQHLFAGAKEVSVIDGYHNDLKILNFDRFIDWGRFYFFTKPLFSVLSFFHKLLGNFGLSILMVTVVLKLIFLPLANKSYASMAKMKAVQPQMDEIKQRYKDNPQEQQKALMELYKKEKINPVAGCWPVLIQIPIFFALYKVLFITIEMRHAPFFGWIKDLAAPDPTTLFNLFGLLPYDPTALPVLGQFIHDYARLGVWPLLMGLTMWLQMKMNPEPTDPMQKQIFGWMPIMFTFMLGSFAAGLVIYWTWNNFLSIIQQGIIMKRHGTKIELWNNVAGLFKKKTSDVK